MAEDQDKSQKTEEPTERKLAKAREKGQVARSQEVNHFFMLIAIALVTVFTFPILMADLLNLFGGVIIDAGTHEVTGATLTHLTWQIVVAFAIAIIPSFLIFMAFAYFSGLVQIGFLFSTDSIQPRASKISPMKGLKKMFSLRSFVDFLKSLIKMIIVGAVIWIIVVRHKAIFITLPQTSIGNIVQFSQRVFLEMVIGVLIIAAIIALLDYMYQKFEYLKENRMTKQEIKDELKDTLGDPQIKQRQRQIRQERAAMRMMEQIPKANVVVTNPTHFSVALGYDQEKDAAPRVLAKGADHVAFKIREKAQEYGIPLLEDPVLARALFHNAEVGDTIPFSYYEAVAKVISYVFNLRQGKNPAYTKTDSLPEVEG